VTILLSAEGMIVMQGICPSEDAEILLRHLANTPNATVDVRHCESAHTAVVQVLLARRPAVQGPPRDNALWRWVYPSIESHK
jgi:hypothetical protein